MNNVKPRLYLLFLSLALGAMFCVSIAYSMDQTKLLSELESKVAKLETYDEKKIEDFLNNEVTKISLNEKLLERSEDPLRTIFYSLSEKGSQNTESFSQILENFMVHDKHNWFNNNQHYKNILLYESIESFKHIPKSMLPFLGKKELFNLLSEKHQQEIFNKIEAVLQHYSVYQKHEKDISILLEALKTYDTKKQFVAYESFLNFKKALDGANGSVEEIKRKMKKELAHHNVDLSNESILKLIKTMIEKDFDNTLLNNFDNWTTRTEDSAATSADPISFDNITSFAQALKTLTNDVFLGPWLAEHYPKRLVAVNEDYNKKHTNKIYQIEVRPQGNLKECGIHAFRNALYVLDMVSSPRNEFNSIYKRMNNEEQYEVFMKNAGCKRDVTMSMDLFNATIEKILNSQIACVPKCIPQNSKQYVKKIKNFIYLYADENKKELPDTMFMNFLNNILSKINKIESDLPNENAVALDVSSLLGNIALPSFVDTIRTFCKSKNSLLAWHVGGFFSKEKFASSGHAVALVEHKYNDEIEYLYADSGFNMPLGESLTLSATIDRIISLTRNLDYFNDTLVRYLYYKLIYDLEEFGSKHRLSGGDAKALINTYNKLQQLNLLNNKIYTSTYKFAFQKLANNLKAKNLDNSKYYDDLLKKFA